MRTENNDRWHFTVQTSSQGNSYVYAYQTKWDPVSKTSRRCSKRYVGRLANDGRVNISDKFAKDFPEYSQGDFYYGATRNLLMKPLIDMISRQKTFRIQLRTTLKTIRAAPV